MSTLLHIRRRILQLNWVGTFYYTAKTDEHVDRSSPLRWRSLSYIRGGIVAVSLHVRWGISSCKYGFSSSRKLHDCIQTITLLH